MKNRLNAFQYTDFTKISLPFVSQLKFKMSEGKIIFHALKRQIEPKHMAMRV